MQQARLPQLVHATCPIMCPADPRRWLLLERKRCHLSATPNAPHTQMTTPCTPIPIFHSGGPSGPPAGAAHMAGLLIHAPHPSTIYTTSSLSHALMPVVPPRCVWIGDDHATAPFHTPHAAPHTATPIIFIRASQHIQAVLRHAGHALPCIPAMPHPGPCSRVPYRPRPRPTSPRPRRWSLPTLSSSRPLHRLPYSPGPTSAACITSAAPLSQLRSMLHLRACPCISSPELSSTSTSHTLHPHHSWPPLSCCASVLSSPSHAHRPCLICATHRVCPCLA